MKSLKIVIITSILFSIFLYKTGTSLAGERKDYAKIYSEGKIFVEKSKNNLRKIKENLNKIDKLLITKLSYKDKKMLKNKRIELSELYDKQNIEITRAKKYLWDMQKNKTKILKIEAEINALDERRAKLDKVYKVGKFRIFYSLNSRVGDSLPSTRIIDNNNDKIPDYIQNIALQLVHAEEFYTEVIGLIHPFEQLQYKNNNLKYIDINVLRSPLDPIQKLIKGKAWNRPTNLKRKHFKNTSEKSLMIDMSSDYNLRYGVPSHELFHLFQFGYTQFISPWFTEGTAVWAQNHFGGVEYSEWKVPKNKQQLLSQKYESSKFWSEICKRVDKYGIVIPNKLTTHKYIGKNIKIIPKNTAKCMVFMRKFFNQLQKIEAKITKEENLIPHKWSTEDMNNPDNEKYIWQALRNSMRSNINTN